MSAQAGKEVLRAGAAGYGCGHNLLGAAALGAAVAVEDLMAAGKLKGTIRFCGTRPVVACGGTSIGHKGLVYAAKVLAATTVYPLEDAKLLQAIQAEFREKTKGVDYKPFVPDGPPPLPKK